jgi:uncharacterized membrane protein YfcA
MGGERNTGHGARGSCMNSRAWLYIVVGVVVLYFLYSKAQASALLAQQQAAASAAASTPSGILTGLLGGLFSTGESAATSAINNAVSGIGSAGDQYDDEDDF